MSTVSFFTLPKEQREKVRNLVQTVIDQIINFDKMIDTLLLTPAQKEWAKEHLSLGILEDDE